ncbi:hypothetical protein ACFUT3_13145 [Streptomyces cinereoruber]|uniref:hypothetical protein n=1 Tax=Streptomyces cinereoruber TaxID=67260 RepID=UPI00362DE2F5
MKSVSQWGCVSVVVLVLLTAGIWIGLVGKEMIVDEPPALCGSRILEEGQTCERYSRSTGETIDSYGPDEAANRQDTAKDTFGWIVVAVGGTLTLAGGALVVMAIKYREDD